MSTDTRGAAAHGAAQPATDRPAVLPFLDSTALLGAVLLAFAAGVTFFVYKDAWVSDDAVITFRYVDNLLHGHGASFNPGDKVQGYTHPLWFLLLSLATVFTADEVYSAVYLGLALTFITAVVLGLGLMQLSKDRITGLAAAALVLVLFCVSDSWRSFQTSGLEGSLSTLLVVLFVLALSQEEVRPPALFFIASLLVLCRPDFALITAPACIYAAIDVWRTCLAGRQAKRWLPAAISLAPLVWFVFAKLYYGDFLPNTGAAKLGTFTLSQGFDQGLTYLGDWVSNEPLTAVAAFTLLAFALTQARRRWEFLLFFGMSAYFFYVLVIGGDFMRGRFYGPFFVAAYVMGAVALARSLSLSTRPAMLGGVAALLVLGALGGPMLAPNQPESRDIPASGVINERMFYVPGYSFDTYRKQKILLNPAIPVATLDSFKRYVEKCGPVTIHIRNPAYIGYYVGPKITLIDLHGLNDYYIARLPNEDLVDHPPRPGHQLWKVPIKYLAERKSVSLLPDWQRKVEDLDCTLPQQAYELRNDPGYFTP
jgi:arabinofuranosyltransferase